MKDSPDPPAAFDPGVIEAVAEEFGVGSGRLAALLAALDRALRPGRTADDIVYEYRRAFARDPLVGRRPGAYYLAVPGHVWPEVGDAVDCTARELRALRALHDRQFHATLGDHADDRDPMIVVREDAGVADGPE